MGRIISDRPLRVNGKTFHAPWTLLDQDNQAIGNHGQHEIPVFVNRNASCPLRPADQVDSLAREVHSARERVLSDLRFLGSVPTDFPARRVRRQDDGALLDLHLPGDARRRHADADAHQAETDYGRQHALSFHFVLLVRYYTTIRRGFGGRNARAGEKKEGRNKLRPSRLPQSAGGFTHYRGYLNGLTTLMPQ